jgi:hypothetical protein
MLVFPQLSSGAAALYPVRRRRRARTVRNVLRDGRAVVYSDPDWARIEWDLDATGWTETEWAAVEALFLAVEGRRGSFTFLDPAGNLLRHSEEFANPVWDIGPLITVTSGVAGPWIGTGAAMVTNAGPAAGEVAQELAAPGDFQYVLSLWVRGNAAGTVTLFAAAGSVAASWEHSVNQQWRRVWAPVRLEAMAETVRFGVRLAAGQSMELFGMQVEAQCAPGDYQRTGARGGVHGAARFASDVLRVRARSTDVLDTTVRIVSKGS